MRTSRSRLLAYAAVLFAVVGLAASIASLVDYLGASPSFCAESGCAQVRLSAWAHPIGIPMPVLGVAFYALMLGLAFAPRFARARLVLSLAGAAWAVFLICLQAFSIGAWCKLCMVADPSALLQAAAIALGAAPFALRWAGPIATLPAVGAIVGVLAFWTHAAPEPAPLPGDALPAWVTSARAATGKTIVEVVDFECPFCRELNRRLQPALAAAPPAKLVRKMVPLPMHKHAMPAALAYCCAEDQGHGDAMAAALFAADPKTLTPDGCAQLAAQVGCDMDRYHRDLPLAVGRVGADMLDARAAGIRSLPTVFIDDQKVVGATASTEQLTAMLR
ncbi:MAG TPA: vitamin K epoxide reductase family protein [Kofleriaceae bacterium]|jgi:uncharacterized membrane protein/predicted DsbA family dithiol-disulfide isomerase